MDSAHSKNDEGVRNAADVPPNQDVTDLAKDMQQLSLEEAKSADKTATPENKSSSTSPQKKTTSNDSPKLSSGSEDGDKSCENKEKPTFKATAANSPNLFFYLNKITSKPHGAFLEVMHKDWWGNYDELEDNHSYIQWLFPNFYGSAFNISADKLEKHEALEFRTNIDIAKRLVKSYELILDFYGMKLANHTTGQLERTEKYKKRYKDALLTYFHNHLRMRRILTHLNNVGFRRYAEQLVDFLETEIYGEVGGFEKYKKEDKSFNTKAFDQAPLKKLAKMNKVFEIWSLYGRHYGDPKRIKLLEENCFAKYPEEFAESVYFRQPSN